MNSVMMFQVWFPWAVMAIGDNGAHILLAWSRRYLSPKPLWDMSFFFPSHFSCSGRVTTPKAEAASRGAEGKWNKYMSLCQKTGLAYSPACSEVAGQTGGKQELTGSRKHAWGWGEELLGRAGCPHLPSYLYAPLLWRSSCQLASQCGSLSALSLQMLKTTWKCGNN